MKTIPLTVAFHVCEGEFDGLTSQAVQRLDLRVSHLLQVGIQKFLTFQTPDNPAGRIGMEIEATHF